jgi:peptide/nickel transport system substrate-binding protein
MKTRKLKVFGVTLLLLALASLIVVGSFGTATAADKPKHGGILRNAEESGPTKSIGIPWTMRGADTQASKPVLESLVRQDRAGNIYPVLATAWEIAPDKSSITLTLRKGVKFHDGSDFTPEVAKWNLDKKIENKARGAAVWSSVDIVGDDKVRLNLKAYENFILNDLTATGGAMISKQAYDTKGEEWCTMNPVGTGPFIFESFDRDVVTKYKRNPNYWNQPLPYLDGLELHYVKDPMTQLAMLQNKEIDVLGADTGKMAADMKAKGYVIEAYNSGTVILIPDSANADSPFAKKKVREAVAYAIDREGIVKARGFGFWEPAYQCIYDGNPGHIPNFKGRTYDPKKARQLLKEAGYPKGFETKLVPMSFGTDKDVWVAVQAYLTAVGIKTELDFVPYSKYTEYRFKGIHNNLLGQPIGIYPNANQTYEFYFAENVNLVNFPTTKRPDGFKELLEKSKNTAKPEPELMHQLAKMIYDDVMVIPIHTTGRAYICQPYVHDTGHMKWGMWTEWRMDEAWMDK